MLDNSEATARLIAFLSVFAVMAVTEILAPRLRRDEMAGRMKGERWFTNISMVVLSSLLLRLVFPAAAVGVAHWAELSGYGIFPSLGVPVILAGIVGFVLLDFAVWLEHVVSHKWPLLWRIHRMHHSDTGFDLTTALRFHPLEIILSMFWKALLVITFGIPAVAVLVFEIVLNAMAMFNHSNTQLPLILDRIMRQVLVTPDMHRVHHSTIPRETDSNYGFNLSIWDRLFGTYVPQPTAGHEKMDIGLNQFRGDSPRHLGWAAMLPFRPFDYKSGDQ